jgi:hypothetical protein
LSAPDLRRRARISQQANNRHADALAVVDSSTTVYDLIDPVTQPQSLAGRRVRALRPWGAPDLPLLKASGSGDFFVAGFRNRDLQRTLFTSPPASDRERRQRSARVSYLLRILRGHGLIEKVAGTHCCHVTTNRRPRRLAEGRAAEGCQGRSGRIAG